MDMWTGSGGQRQRCSPEDSRAEMHRHASRRPGLPAVSRLWLEHRALQSRRCYRCTHLASTLCSPRPEAGTAPPAQRAADCLLLSLSVQSPAWPRRHQGARGLLLSTGQISDYF